MSHRYLHPRHFVVFRFLFGVLSVGCAVTSTRIWIIYYVILKIKQKINIIWILKDKDFQPILHVAMLGCRYPMVPTSALHQWVTLNYHR